MTEEGSPETALDLTGLEAGTTRSKAMLLGPADLPGRGWEVVEERSWPTGQLDPTSEKSQRALEVGGITFWRSLRQGEPEADRKRSAWVEVVPYSTAEDACLSLSQVPRFFVGVVGENEIITEEHTVVDRQLPGIEQTWFYEKATTSPAGSAVARYAGGTVGEVLFLACFTAREPWGWELVLDLSKRQADRVASALEAEHRSI